jgi:hypothetical protein
MLEDFHRPIAVQCFNDCWTYIEKEHRSEAEEEEMRRLAEVSFWAWRNSPACTPKNIAIGYWQLARVYALSRMAEPAHRYAVKAITSAEDAQLGPFYLGYAHEATARAALLSGDRKAFADAIEKAYACLAEITDEEERTPLEADLNALTLESRPQCSA